MMKGKLEKLAHKDKSHATLPVFYRLRNDSDKQLLNTLLNENANIIVFDELQCQVEELIKCQNPKVKYSKEGLTIAAKKHIGDMPNEEYGVWVYYPWSNRLLHILDEKEFIEVRTSRNQNKITKE